jgi:threonine/homoserine/homoserine lactone efflux protein
VTALIAGFGLGFGVAAGFGPINVLCLASGLRHGFLPAWGVGVGAALVDGFYALLAGLGVAAVLHGSAKGWFQIVGGVALVLVALRMARPSHAEERAEATLARTLAISIGATLANPLTIISWAAAFAGVVPRLDLSRTETLGLLPLGVMAGTLVWFTSVSAGGSLAGHYVNERLLRRLSAVSGVAIAGFGAWLIAGGVGALT